MTQVRITSFSRNPDGTLSVYNICEVDPCGAAYFFRRARREFEIGNTDAVYVGSAAEPMSNIINRPGALGRLALARA